MYIHWGLSLYWCVLIVLSDRVFVCLWLLFSFLIRIINCNNKLLDKACASKISKKNLAFTNNLVSKTANRLTYTQRTRNPNKNHICWLTHSSSKRITAGRSYNAEESQTESRISTIESIHSSITKENFSQAVHRQQLIQTIREHRLFFKKATIDHHHHL